MRSGACDTLIRLCARHVLCRLAFPLVPALRSIDSAAADSAADCSAAGRHVVRRLPSYYGEVRLLVPRASSASTPRLPDADHRTRHPLDTDGQTRDLPASDAILLHVMWP